MNRITRTLSALILPGLFAWVVIGGSPVLAQAQAQAQGAKADLKDAQGHLVGSAVFAPAASGVKLLVRVDGFTSAAAGEHGIHVHGTGKCEAAAFTSAGGHFNPNSKKHGLNNSEGHHAGDLPNIVFDAAGNATYETVIEGITLGDGPASLIDTDGSALVIHAGPDDMVTDPAGNSGARVVCGELAAYAIPVAGMPQTGSPAGATLFVIVGLFAALALIVLGRRIAAVRG